MENIFEKYTDFFIKNEYFDKYVLLCSQNDLGITQRHHIIPVSYFKEIKQDIDNSPSNIVNLSPASHIIAHYYLYNCTSDKYIYSKNSSACMVFLNSNINIYNSIIDNFEDQIAEVDYNSIYEAAIKHISESKKNKTYIHDPASSKTILVNNDELEMYFNTGYLYGRPKNKICVTNGIITKHILKDELEEYIKLGWKQGHNHITSQKLSEYITMNKDNHETRIPRYKVDEYVSDGWAIGRSKSALYNMAVNRRPTKYKGTKGVYKGTCTNYVWITDGIMNEKRLLPDEAVKFIHENEGWRYGQLSRRWLTNGSVTVHVVESEVQEYLSKGYIFGMKKRKS